MECATHLGIIHRVSNDSASLCPTFSKPEKNSLHTTDLISPTFYNPELYTIKVDGMG